MAKQTIGICHYRIGKTDGVSLEIRKRKTALEKIGYKVVLIAGPIQETGDYLIPLLEFDRPDVLKIRHNAFEKFEDFKSDLKFEEYISNIANTIKQDFLKIHKKEKFEYLFVHNIFTHGRHIAAANAFYDIAQDTKIKIISVNHDFHWVGSYKDIYQPTTPFVKKYLKKYVPPTLPQITHVAINSINQKALQDRIHQKVLLLPDTFNFQQKPWIKDKYNSDFLKKIGAKKNDLIVLQATRITKRKGIELAIDFVAELDKNIYRLAGKSLYNGKTLDKSSRVVLVLAGYAEKDSLEYKNSLKKLIRQSGIKARFISEIIAAQRKRERDKKVYSLWDSYVYSDLVTFPSLWEGWGNQFIEAVFAKKPVVIFEYPVFKEDIKKEGYKVISLGEKTLARDNDELVKVPSVNMLRAFNETLHLMCDQKTKKILDDNFKDGEKYHSDKFLKDKLLYILQVADNK